MTSRGNWTDEPCFYVSVVDGKQFALVAGPFRTHGEALAIKDRAVAVGSTVDPKSWFYAWGTVKMKTGHRDGVLNTHLGLQEEHAMSIATKQDAIDAVPVLRPFIGPQQLHVLGDACRGEEKEFFFAKLKEYADRINGMPKTYEQDGKGDQAIVFLHYFRGGMDWYITEKDSDQDGEGQQQAFGWADLGAGGEWGYICLPELFNAVVELDLYFTPKPLADVLAKKGR